MPTTLPAPSKGALRALRNLALGTSCTLALGAGLLTEDRRRRIRAAREVHDNAKKLKSSRKYHNTGNTVIETFEAQLLRYREDAFWLPSNVLKSTPPKATASKETNNGGAAHNLSPSHPPMPTPVRISRYEPGSRTDVLPPKPSSLPFLKTKTSQHALGNTRPEPPKVPKQGLHNRQGKLATDVTNLLQDPDSIHEAASRFFEAFEEGLSIDGVGISQRLLEAAIQLANACEAQLKFENSEKVFDIILGSGALHEEHFHLFHPEAIICRLLHRPSSDRSSLDQNSLRKASAIFLTKFKEKPKPLSKRMFSLGERLCAETCQSGMYDLTLDLYSRLQSCRENGTIEAVAPLIIATHMKGHHKKVFQYFHKYYLQTTPDQLEFFNTGGLAIESILKTGRIDRAEKTLIAACEMAEKSRILTSTTWFLKVLGHVWRTHRDLEQTTSLFGRLEPFLHVAQHPQAFYGAMIQFCIEANDEPLAQCYYDTMRRSYPPVPGDVRIYGHFAFAKAKRNDWLGVKDDFLKMKRTSPGSAYIKELASSFHPILQLYIRCHTISDTEEFIRYFVDEIGIKITKNLTRTMVEAYGKAKEIDSLTKLIDYSAAAGCPIDSVTFNTILRKCYQSWGFPYWEIYRLYRAVCSLDSIHSRFIDEETVPTLRRLAILGSPPQEELLRRLKVLKKLDRTPDDALDSKAILRTMAVTMAKDNPIATLKIYKRAQKDRVLLDSKHLHLAVRASLQLHPNTTEETLRHIQDAQAVGVDVSNAIGIIIIHQMTATYEEGNEDSRLVTELTQKTVTTFEKAGLKVSPIVVTHAVSILEKRGHNRLCVDVWNSLSHRLNFEPSSFDLFTLTVLLKAYIGLRDHVGIQWVVKTLSANKLCPDPRFRLYLKNARRETTNLLRSGEYSENMLHFLDVLVEAIEATRLLREEAAEERRGVMFKTIQIIEKAIVEEAARQERGSSDSPEAFEESTEIVLETLSQTSSIDALEPWIAQNDGGGHHEMDIPSPQILVEVGAG
ncbi:uncharacterized protein K444DRAFT_618685 [Hyaloscypha bicolor E]|uniref:Pentacotripeptide-repeat region of PRORP domain-containing protein n=1 Tax=Hyaloscypha bicolor E TaxID=1095630 RepID=A0A2J6STZ0_9HELO|nr:uncharacterized protein K444DRAFT_618685 [Hyaloscypha bicolor E]PMD54227.1 hypothetical protein K444DRAFT_618685 [Hyaloscypha bicolor E]